MKPPLLFFSYTLQRLCTEEIMKNPAHQCFSQRRIGEAAVLPGEPARLWHIAEQDDCDKCRHQLTLHNIPKERQEKVEW